MICERVDSEAFIRELRRSFRLIERLENGVRTQTIDQFMRQEMIKRNKARKLRELRQQ